MAAFDSSPYGMSATTRHKGLGEIDLTGMDMISNPTRRTASPTPIGHHHPPRFNPKQHPARHDSHGMPPPPSPHMPPPSPAFHPGRRNVHSPPPRNMTYPHPPQPPHPHPPHPPQPSRTFPGPGPTPGPQNHPQQYSTSQPPQSFGHNREINLRRVQSIEQGMGLARKTKPHGLVFAPRSEEPDFERIRSPPLRSPTLIASQEMDQHLFVPPQPRSIPLSESPTSFDDDDDDDDESLYSNSNPDRPYGGYAPHRVASPEIMSTSTPATSRPPSHAFPKRKSSLSNNSISNARPATSHGQQNRKSGVSGMPLNNRHSANSHRYSGKIGAGTSAPPLVTLKMPVAFTAVHRQSVESSAYSSPASPSSNSLMGKRFIAGFDDHTSPQNQHLTTPTSHPAGMDPFHKQLQRTGLPSPPPSTNASPHTSTLPDIGLVHTRASFRSGVSSDNGRSSMAMTDDEFAGNELSIEDAIGMYETDSDEEERRASGSGRDERQLTLEEQRVLLEREFRSQQMRTEQLRDLRERRESERSELERRESERRASESLEQRESKRESRAEQLRRESMASGKRESVQEQTEQLEQQKTHELPLERTTSDESQASTEHAEEKDEEKEPEQKTTLPIPLVSVQEDPSEPMDPAKQSLITPSTIPPPMAPKEKRRPRGLSTPTAPSSNLLHLGPSISPTTPPLPRSPTRGRTPLIEDDDDLDDMPQLRMVRTGNLDGDPYPPPPPHLDRNARDRYGFKKASQHVSIEEYEAWAGPYHEMQERRRIKWEQLMAEAGLPVGEDGPVRFPPKSQKLKRYVRKGIPPEWRGAAWFWFAGGPQVMSKNGGLYERLLQHHKDWAISVPDYELIERDLHRTFPDNIHFKPDPNDTPEGTTTRDSLSKPPETPILQSLRRVLVAFAIYVPKIGYCQSLNFIAGLLLLFLPEEKTFWMLYIITHQLLPGTHDTRLGSEIDQGVLMLCVRDCLPSIWAKVGESLDGALTHEVGVTLPPITLSTVSWFMNAYVTTLPIETALRIWDTWFYEGSKTLFRMALTILKLGENEIRQVSDPGESLMVVQNLPRKLIDPTILMELCFKRRNGFGHLSQQEVDQKREERKRVHAGIRGAVAPPINVGPRARQGGVPGLGAGLGALGLGHGGGAHNEVRFTRDAEGFVSGVGGKLMKGLTGR